MRLEIERVLSSKGNLYDAFVVTQDDGTRVTVGRAYSDEKAELARMALQATPEPEPAPAPEPEVWDVARWAAVDAAAFDNWIGRVAMHHHPGGFEDGAYTSPQVILPISPVDVIRSSFVPPEVSSYDAAERVLYAVQRLWMFSITARVRLLRTVLVNMVRRHGTPNVDNDLLRRPGDASYGQPYDATLAVAFLEALRAEIPFTDA